MSKTIYTKDPAKRFYVYAFLREDRTPYYIGKGAGNRAWKKRRRNSPPADSSRIIILFENLTETEAFSEEIRLIQFYGRKDNGTGILRNLTDGGEGSSGYKHTQESLDKMSEAMTGKKHTPERIAKRSGENHPMFGKKASAETRAKLSAANSGENNPNYGKHHTQDTLDKMSEAKSGENNPMFGKKSPMFGKKATPETLAKRLATRKRNKEAKALREEF